jgi:hypothetical protein
MQSIRAKHDANEYALLVMWMDGLEQQTMRPFGEMLDVARRLC